MKFFKYFLKVFLPVVVLIISFLIARQIISGKKKIKLHAAPPTISVVEAEALKKTDFRVVLTSHGTVRARTESAVVPEVSGKVVEISANLREGGFFKEGELLISLDPRNYAIEVALKEAELAKASQLLIEEEARAALAMRNWKRLRPDKAPSPLAVRRPQVMSARAELKAARAKLDRAELDLERTHIAAPYSGRVLEKNLDLGEYVTAGSSVARIYAVDFAEIRLPLSPRELDFVEIKDLYRDKNINGKAHLPHADIIASHRGKDYKWKARIVRSEGAIDEKSRQLFVVAEVVDPYGTKGASTRLGPPPPPLKVGAFVKARIQGRLLRDVFVVPRRALRVGTELFIIKDGLLERRKVNLVWKDGENIVIDGGVEEGEFVVTTPAVYMKAGKFKIAPPAPPAPPAVGQSSPAAGHSLREGKAPTGQSPSTSKEPTQGKAIKGNASPVTKSVPATPAAGHSLREGEVPTPPAVEHSLREGKAPTGQSPLISKESMQGKKKLLASKPVLARQQSQAISKKPKQAPTTLGIVLPVNSKTDSRASSPSKYWDLSELDKRPDSKTRPAPPTPPAVGQSSPAAGHSLREGKAPAGQQSSATSKEPKQGKAINDKKLPAAKSIPESRGWNIPAFDSEKKHLKKEVVR